MMWKHLDEEEKDSYVEWARLHYVPFGLINGFWHPIIQSECVLINLEEGSNYTPADIQDVFNEANSELYKPDVFKFYMN